MDIDLTKECICTELTIIKIKNEILLDHWNTIYKSLYIDTGYRITLDAQVLEVNYLYIYTHPVLLD